MVWPNFSAQAGTRRFEAALLAEHVDEAAFLYEQRRRRLGTEDAWSALGDVEMRLDAHVDALAIAGAPALECALERAGQGSAADLFVAACIACRREDWPVFRKLAASRDPAGEGHGQALADAFYVEAPRQWAPQAESLLRMLGERTPPELLLACGRRRFAVGSLLVPMLGFPACAAAAASALGRLQDEAAADALYRCVDAGDEPTRRAALTALCRMGHTEHLRRAMAASSTDVWWHGVAGVAGDSAAVQVLLRSVEDGTTTGATVLAMGLLGDPAAVPALLHVLANAGLADAAARALDWMTGADFVEERFVPDEVDEAALSADELRTWRETGQAPRRRDGSEFGSRVRQRVTDAQVWRDWFGSHAARFTKGQAYRLGQPRGRLGLAQLLALPRADPVLRTATVEELTIRFRCDLPLETDLPVAIQTRLVGRLLAWASAPRGEPALMPD